MEARLPPLIARAARFPDRIALVGPDETASFRELDSGSAVIAAGLLDGRTDLREERVAFLVGPGVCHVLVQWGIWRAGGIAVPLARSHPAAELSYVVKDAEASILVVDPDQVSTVLPITRETGLRLTTPDQLRTAESAPLPPVTPARRAMMVYTSGTTGRPKGAVSTHAVISAQIASLVEAWEWSPDDRILHVLPLHHVHGIINALCCPLWAGATCELLPRFDPEPVWNRLASGEITVFMAVPTIYQRLIAAWEQAGAAEQRHRAAGASRLRLMVSGSAALPAQVFTRWREITGQALLERYGMTEIGMALSNPLRGERRPGYVGAPLPSVDVRLVDEQGLAVPPGTPGEIEVRGPTLFLEYWRRPEATRDAFRDSWFRTGDLAIVEQGRYRILGRTSIDIIKTGGYKVSALEIEAVLREHPAIVDCAVVGVADPEWGEQVCAAVELRPGTALTLESLTPWARERLAPYKLPRTLRPVPALPRNAMGKVVKPEVRRLFTGG